MNFSMLSLKGWMCSSKENWQTLAASVSHAAKMKLHLNYNSFSYKEGSSSAFPFNCMIIRNIDLRKLLGWRLWLFCSHKNHKSCIALVSVLSSVGVTHIMSSGN